MVSILEKKLNEKRVYARLVQIALECWQHCPTDLPFHEWMERKGLLMQDGFFKAIEEPVVIFAH